MERYPYSPAEHKGFPLRHRHSTFTQNTRYAGIISHHDRSKNLAPPTRFSLRMYARKGHYLVKRPLPPPIIDLMRKEDPGFLKKNPIVMEDHVEAHNVVALCSFAIGEASSRVTAKHSSNAWIHDFFM